MWTGLFTETDSPRKSAAFPGPRVDQAVYIDSELEQGPHDATPTADTVRYGNPNVNIIIATQFMVMGESRHMVLQPPE